MKTDASEERKESQGKRARHWEKASESLVAQLATPSLTPSSGHRGSRLPMSSWKGVWYSRVAKGLHRDSIELKGQEETLQSCPTVVV